MADDLKTALRLLRGEPGELGRALSNRLSSVRRELVGLLSKPEEPDLDVLIDELAGERRRPGQLVWAMQKPDELRAFLKLVSERPPRAVLEIGTAAGGMLKLLARVSGPEALVLSVDLRGGPFGGGYAAWRGPIYRRFASSGQRLHLIRGSSRDVAVRQHVIRLLNGRQLDLLFIDGDHSLAGVQSDFELYSGLVRAGGLIALHDIVPNPADPAIGVPSLWRSYREHFEVQEIVEREGPPGYGIGVVRWRGSGQECA